MKNKVIFAALYALMAIVSVVSLSGAPVCLAEETAEKKLKIMFLGDNGHHRPSARCAELADALKSHGIDVLYTDKMSDLNAENLAKYDGLMIYSNTLKMEEDQEKAMLDYIASGKGFAPIHCASACFKNSTKYLELVGAEFKSHKTGVFDTKIVNADHPIMKNFVPFSTWDETYVHAKHNDNRTMLQTRQEGAREEPWTWVRTHGKGRVFYTAYGHDERTWTNPGFQELIERGLRWSCGDDQADAHTKVRERLAKPVTEEKSAPKAESKELALPNPQPKRTDVKPFEFEEANVPFYSPGGKRVGADGWNKMQKPLPPEESQKHLIVPEGFEAQLFASEPEITKPIAMAWDHKGRLWIAETVDYPNNKNEPGKGHDRIKICEDTDGDGRADKFTVFAENLSIPTSLTFANGGVIVHQAPETLFLKSKSGGDKADEIKTLISGWGVRDTHAGPSNLHWGPDNWIWGIVGYSGFVGDVGGENFKFGQGFYRFKPDGSKLEFIRSNNNNSWGLGFSEEGYIFGSTANGNSNVYVPLFNRSYESVRGWSASALKCIADSLEMHPATEKVRQVDWHGKFTAAAGHSLYTARTYPQAFWNRTAFVNEPTGHVTATFILEPNGSDFSARNVTNNLVASDDEWTAPISAEVGPDGNMWVIDWYNYIVQHNPTPSGFKSGKGNAYEIPLRDKVHGRIYRIVSKSGKPSPQPKLDPNDPATLIPALKNENMFWRTTAQRLLVERANADVVPELIKLTQDTSLDALKLTPGAIHALWTLKGLGVLDGKNAEANSAVVAALKHPSPAVRRNAVQVLPRDEASTKALLDSGVIEDAEAQVRLAAILAMSEMPRSEAVASKLVAAMGAANNMEDRWIPDAITAAGAAHDVEFLKALATNPSKKAYDKVGLEIARRVSEHFARGTPTQSIGGLLTALDGCEPKLLEAMLTGIEAGWPKTAKAPLDEAAEKVLVKLSTTGTPGVKGRISSLAQKWNSQLLNKYTAEIAASLKARLTDAKESDDAHLLAANQLVSLRRNDPEVVRDIFKLITPQAAPEYATGLLEAIRQSEAPTGGEILVDGLKNLAPSARATAFSVLLGKAEWTETLLKGFADGKAQISDLSLDQKASIAEHPDKKIADAAKKLLASGGGMPDADRQKVIDELAKKVLVKGDAVKGKQVFKDNCMKCHMHSGEGAKIGPDLSGMSAHPKQELLIHIFDPSRSIEGNYKQYMLKTTEGVVITGLLASESKTSIELLDAEGKTHPIQRENIKTFQASPKSLMPEGFEKAINEEGITNLLEFLTQRGKFVPLDLSKVASVISTEGMFTNKGAKHESLPFDDWKPKTFAGVTFNLIDPQGTKVRNAILFNSNHTALTKAMPNAVTLPCNFPVKAIHMLSGVGGWCAREATANGTVSLIVRITYQDGKLEDHPLRNGVHFADYNGLFDVPESKLAFKLMETHQIRYLSVRPKRQEPLKQIELVKGPDSTSPFVIAVTVETAD